MTSKSSFSNSPSQPYESRSIDSSELAPFLHHVVEINGVKLEVEQIVKGILSEIDLAKQDHPYLEDCEVSFVGRYVTQLLVKKNCQTNDIDIKVKMPHTPEGLDISDLSLLLEKIVENSLTKLLKLEEPYREKFKKNPGLCPKLLTLQDKLAIENYSLSSETKKLPVEISLNTLKDETVPTHALASDSFYISFALFDGKLGSKQAGPGEYRLCSIEGNYAQIEETVKLGKIRTTVLPNDAFEQIWFRMVKDITIDGDWNLDPKSNEEFFTKEAVAGERILKNMDSFISKKEIRAPLFYLVNALFLLPPKDPFPSLFLRHLETLLKKAKKPVPEWLSSLEKVLQEEKNPQEAISLLKGLMPLFAEKVSLKEDHHYQCTFTVNGQNYYILVPPFTEDEKHLFSSRRIPQFPLTPSNVKENLSLMSLEKFLLQLKKSLPLATEIEDKTKLSCGSLKQIFTEHHDKLETLSSAFWEEARSIISVAITEQSRPKPWKDLLMLLLPSIKEAPIEEMKTFLRTFFQKVDALPLPMKEKDPFLYPLYARAIMDKSISVGEFLEQEITDSHIEEIKKCCTLWNTEDPFNFNRNFGTLLQEPEKALKLLKMQLAIENSPEGKIKIALRAYQACEMKSELASILEKEFFLESNREEILLIAERISVPYQTILNRRIEHYIMEKKPVLACSLLKCLPSEDPSIAIHLNNLIKRCEKIPEKAIQVLQSEFAHHSIAVLKEDLPSFLALNKKDPLKTIEPLLVNASPREKNDLAQRCVMLTGEVNEEAQQNLFNLLVKEENVESCLQEVPQTLDCFNKWMNFLKEAHLLSEPVSMQLVERIQRIQEDPINKLIFINRLYPFLKEEDKTICLEQVASTMQRSINQNEPLDKILPFTTFLLKMVVSEERYEKIRFDCFSFFIDRLEEITKLSNTNENRNILFKLAEGYFSSNTTDLKAALVNKCLTLPYERDRVTLLNILITNAENCDFLQRSSEPWSDEKLNNGLIFLQTDPSSMKKFIGFAIKNMIDCPTPDVVKKIGPYLEEDARLILFEKGLEELNKAVMTQKKADIEKSLLILLKSSSNKIKLAKTALERLDFYPAGMIKELSSDWNEDLISIFTQKIKAQAETITKLKGPFLEPQSINYINCLTEIKKPPNLLENPDVYIPFLGVAYPYIFSLSLSPENQKTNKFVGIIESLIKKPLDLSSIPEKNQYDVLLALFSCPTFLATQNNTQLLDAIKNCPISIILKMSDRLLTWPSQHKALWVQGLISKLEQGTEDPTLVFQSLQDHLYKKDLELLKILSSSPSTPGKGPRPQSTLMKLTDCIIKYRLLPTDSVSLFTKSLRSILLQNPTLKDSAGLAFKLLKEVHNFRLNQHTPENPLKIQIDFQEYLDFLEKLEVPKGSLIAYLTDNKLFLGNSNLYPILKVYDKPQSIFIIHDMPTHLALINRIRIHKGTKSENLKIDTNLAMLSLYLLSFMSYPYKVPEDDKTNFYSFIKNNIQEDLPLNFLLHEITGDQKIQRFHEILYLIILPTILELSIKELRSLAPKELEQKIFDKRITLIPSSSSMLLYYFTSSSDLPAKELKDYLLYMIPKLFPDTDDLGTFFSHAENYVQRSGMPEHFATPTKRLDYALFLMQLTNHMMATFVEGKVAPKTLDYLAYKTEENLSIVSEYLKHDPKPNVIAKLKAIQQEIALPKEKMPKLLQDICSLLDATP